MVDVMHCSTRVFPMRVSMRSHVEPDTKFRGAAIVRQREVTHVDLVHACRGLNSPVLYRAGVTRLYPHWVGWVCGVDYPQVGNQAPKPSTKSRCTAMIKTPQNRDSARRCAADRSTPTGRPHAAIQFLSTIVRTC